VSFENAALTITTRSSESLSTMASAVVSNTFEASCNPSVRACASVMSVALVMIWVGWSNRHGIPPVETVGEVVDDFTGDEPPVTPDATVD